VSLAVLASKLKRLDVGERWVRRNPLYYATVSRELAYLESVNVEERESWVHARLNRVLKAAAHTPYGRSVGAPRNIADWPLLPKETVRDRPEAFLRAARWVNLLNAHAATGGTTGVPLRLQRSPESVVAEQVCQDDALIRLGLDARTAKLAVLRGDDIKDPSDMNPPFWTHAMGGKRLILSSNHLSASTLEAFATALREFVPDVLWVYPTTLE